MWRMRLSTPIISIVGKSKSGKTTLLEKLIPELKSRGYRIGVIKHDVHNHQIDIPGKDSYRIKESGAETIIISSSKKISMIRDLKEEIDLRFIEFKYLEDMDLILTEGYKRRKFPKIEVLRSKVSKEPSCSPNEVFAFISDFPIKSKRPVFDIDDIKAFADFIESKFLLKKKKKKVELFAGGKKIPVKKFVQDFIINVIKAMLSSLKGVDKDKKIELKIEEEK